MKGNLGFSLRMKYMSWPKVYESDHEHPLQWPLSLFLKNNVWMYDFFLSFICRRDVDKYMNKTQYTVSTFFENRNVLLKMVWCLLLVLILLNCVLIYTVHNLLISENSLRYVWKGWKIHVWGYFNYRR